jgi:hypothetical protein
LSLTEGAQIIKDFQLKEATSSEKSKPEYGIRIAKYISATVNQGIGGYFFDRNARYRQNRNAAAGKIDMTRFRDFLELNGKTNYVNINWQSIRIVNRIVSGLVGRWMGNEEKIKIKAIDSLSLKQKEDEYRNIEFIMKNKEMLMQLQQESGVQVIPQDTQIPADDSELNLWVSQFQKLPEEIKYEMACNDALESCGWFDTLKEKILSDSATCGFVGTYTWMDGDGVIHIDWVKPENAFYSYSDFPDFRDTTWRGQVRALKISELRRKYGAEFGGKLTEDQIWKIAGTSKEFQLYDKITWLDQWVTAYSRPYDEWNVDSYELEIKTVDSEDYTVATTKKNKSTIVKKGKPQRLGDNEVLTSDTKWNIYRGVYLRDSDTLLEWGVKKNMIRSHDPKEMGNAEFSYSFYMYQNYRMRNVAVPEKIEEPADQMILARLKMQQLVAKMRPTGAAYNVDAMREIDLGLASGSSSPSELQRIYDQTGNLYYSGRDAEGNPIPVPIQELANAGFLNQMKGLVDLYQFHYQVLKDELGEDPNLIAQALRPRVTSSNVNTAQDAANNATGYMYDAYKWVMADTAKKVCCLLKDSVEYGSSVYRKLIKEDDVKGRNFSTRIQMLPTEVELQKFESMLNYMVQSNPSFVMYIDPFQLMRVAKEDVTLAEVLLRKGQKTMIMQEMQKAQQQSEMNAQIQMQSAQASEQEKRKTMEMEMQTKAQIESMVSRERQKETILSGIFGIYQKGMQVPDALKSLEAEIINNVALPLFAENMAMDQMMQQGQGQEQPQEGQQPEQGQEMPPPEEQGQEMPQQA